MFFSASAGRKLQTAAAPWSHSAGDGTIYVLWFVLKRFFFPHSDGAINMPDNNMEGPHKMNVPPQNIKLEV